MATCDPNSLSVAAAQFAGLSHENKLNVLISLLCQINAGGGGGGTTQDMQVAWTPTNLKLGEILGFFTFGDTPGITSITFNQSTSISGFDIENNSSITSLSWPNLTNIDPTNIQGGYFWLSGDTALTTVSMPKFTWLSPSVARINITGCPLLTDVDLSALVPLNGKDVFLNNNALTAASVNLVLARCVANAAFVSGNVGLSGGTNAAPTGQGIVDKATLIGRGVTVNTN